MRKLAERWLTPICRKQPQARDCTYCGDRIEVRQLWAHSTDPESIGLYAASQVFAVQREVIPLSKAVKASKELCYAITSTEVVEDSKRNGEQLLRTFRGHWTVEGKTITGGMSRIRKIAVR